MEPLKWETILILAAFVSGGFWGACIVLFFKRKDATTNLKRIDNTNPEPPKETGTGASQ